MALRRDSIEQNVARATRVLEEMARELAIALPADGVQNLRLVPCPAPGSVSYGTRTGTWAEAADFVREWHAQGKDWVNIGLRVASDGAPYLCYEVPDRGEPGEPRDYPGPAININGPDFGPPTYSHP